MDHPKKFVREPFSFQSKTLYLEGPLQPNEIEALDYHEALVSFRPAEAQKKALIEIAELPEGRINVIRDDQKIVGYVTFVYPDPLERWSEGKMENLIELGAIEIAPEYRANGLGKQLLQISMKDPAMENYIIITTEYYWHWDLKGSGLDVWEYRKVMEKMMNAGGLIWFATDDPEISSHPANCLMARIGANIDQASMEQFDQLRFVNRFMY
ncbi:MULTISPECIES: GNAT family N-acetyltransferase [Shouchella]|uniref:GNAT family N-acetyltransferase n=2 Tax=Shouchella TaxID=2893057 RepID=A0ABY7W8T3_9BACI|nr:MULTISPECIES: GNAT family N-acetyltransferase [Shouchella]MED4129966.1 GNAT family N-acetyltransferase [Shouchella miscanthi]WDF04242.1 GNAT family N-acetyltransferase [Shouchella hunanensis]GAF21241.1 acetyltransferase AcuA, acetyl-CoA synthetase inhibitor [Bacillus sp. JCM 19047]